jgi:uncharacterized membrane protein YcaP (DUF421 family)
VKSQPIVVVRYGELLHGALRSERLNAEEVHQAIRSSGLGGIELVAAVVVETDGSISVISTARSGSRSAIPAVSADDA